MIDYIGYLIIGSLLLVILPVTFYVIKRTTDKKNKNVKGIFDTQFYMKICNDSLSLEEIEKNFKKIDNIDIKPWVKINE